MYYYFNCCIYMMLINYWNTYTYCFVLQAAFSFAVLCTIMLNCPALMITPSIRDHGVILTASPMLGLFTGLYRKSRNTCPWQKPRQSSRYGERYVTNKETTGIREHEGNVKNTSLRRVFSTFLECSQMSGVFYHSVVNGLGFFICFIT